MKHPTEPKESYLARGFRDVDAAVCAKMARCLGFLNSLSSFRHYKSLMLAAMGPKPGQITADLGCGLGFDVLGLAELVGPGGCAIGVGSSMILLQSACSMSQNSASATFVRADIQNLPLEDQSPHSCKVDRTLQHVERPRSVLSEMFRIVRPGGVVACAEPDWGTFTIDHDNRAMVRQIVEIWGESFRNPWIGRQLSNDLREAGFVDIQVRGTLLIAPSFESADKVFDIVQTAERLAETTRNDEPLERISNVKDRDRMRPVRSSVALFLNVARRPLRRAG